MPSLWEEKFYTQYHFWFSCSAVSLLADMIRLTALDPSYARRGPTMVYGLLRGRAVIS